MKKILYLMVLALAYVACTKEVPPPTTPAQPPTVEKTSLDNAEKKLRVEFFTS